MENKFMLGYNYWSSDAGIYMWKNFNKKTIEKDFEFLESYNVNTIRMFPLWEDFQPIKMYYTYNNSPMEIRYSNDETLPDTEEGICGIDIKMIEKLKFVLDCAEKHHIRVILGILTGWMSGRLFVPQALEGKNLMCDPLALKWEIRYIRYIVKHFTNHPAIYAFDIGNECNCIGPCPPDQTYVWVHMVCSTIKQYDTENHILMSGMALNAPYENGYSMREQAELLDVLVTHPYNMFQKNCTLDPTISFRSIMHSSMETSINRSISGKPCFPEEIGTLEPVFANEEVTADFSRLSLYETLGRGFGGMLWWCAFEQKGFKYPPYDWNAIERELGGIKAGYKPKAFTEEFKKFGDVIKENKLENVPAPEYDAVCILTHGQDTWNTAYGAYALARQNDVNLNIVLPENKLPDSNIYLLPSIKGDTYVHYNYFCELLEKVKEGATLYVSFDSTVAFTDMTKYCGANIRTSRVKHTNRAFDFKGNKISIGSSYEYTLNVQDATVLASDENGNAVMTEHKYGQGKVILLTLPLEQFIGSTPDVMSDINADRYDSIYKYVCKDAIEKHKLCKNERYILKTEVKLDDSRFMVILANPTEYVLKDKIVIDKSLKLSKVIGTQTVVQKGEVLDVELPSAGVALLFF